MQTVQTLTEMTNGRSSFLVLLKENTLLIDLIRAIKLMPYIGFHWYCMKRAGSYRRVLHNLSCIMISFYNHFLGTNLMNLQNIHKQHSKTRVLLKRRLRLIGHDDRTIEFCIKYFSYVYSDYTAEAVVLCLAHIVFCLALTLNVC